MRRTLALALLLAAPACAEKPRPAVASRPQAQPLASAPLLLDRTALREAFAARAPWIAVVEVERSGVASAGTRSSSTVATVVVRQRILGAWPARAELRFYSRGATPELVAGKTYVLALPPSAPNRNDGPRTWVEILPGRAAEAARANRLLLAELGLFPRTGP